MLPEGAQAEAVLDTLPGKKALIKLSYRPPNYETPIDAFGTAITPNDVFFVRYHLSDIPKVDANTWKVAVGGEGAKGEIEVTLDDLRKMPAFEVTAVNQCSGNRRGLFQPHVAGVQWGYGAMGCARWKGARASRMCWTRWASRGKRSPVFGSRGAAPDKDRNTEGVRQECTLSDSPFWQISGIAPRHSPTAWIRRRRIAEHICATRILTLLLPTRRLILAR
jgi:hypothetical protein